MRGLLIVALVVAAVWPAAFVAEGVPDQLTGEASLFFVGLPRAWNEDPDNHERLRDANALLEEAGYRRGIRQLFCELARAGRRDEFRLSITSCRTVSREDLEAPAPIGGAQVQLPPAGLPVRSPEGEESHAILIEDLQVRYRQRLWTLFFTWVPMPVVDMQFTTVIWDNTDGSLVSVSPGQLKLHRARILNGKLGLHENHMRSALVWGTPFEGRLEGVD